MRAQPSNRTKKPIKKAALRDGIEQIEKQLRDLEATLSKFKIEEVVKSIREDRER